MTYYNSFLVTIVFIPMLLANTINKYSQISEMYLGPCRTFLIEVFYEIVNDYMFTVNNKDAIGVVLLSLLLTLNIKPLTITAKRSIKFL